MHLKMFGSLKISFHNSTQESQIPTQRYGRRPFGVGLLVAGYDVSISFFVVQLQLQLFKKISLSY